MPIKYTTDDIIVKGVEIYGFEFDYSETEYINTSIPFIVICDTHGRFQTTYAQHIRNKVGCSECNKAIPEQKACTKCKVVKPLDEFYKDKGSRDGRSSTCNVCGRAASQATKERYRNGNAKIAQRKKCAKCGVEKAPEEFHKDRTSADGRNNKCIICTLANRELNKETINRKWREYYSKYKGYEKVRKHLYYLRNKERVCARTNIYGKMYKKTERAKHLRKLRDKKPHRIIQKRVAYQKWIKRRCENDPGYQILSQQRARLAKILRVENSTRMIKEWIGCDLNTLKLYLESQFTPQMNWRNYGSYWAVDHIVPCAFFDRYDPIKSRLCWHYTNLQPLEKYENIKKSGSLSAVLPVFAFDE